MTRGWPTFLGRLTLLIGSVACGALHFYWWLIVPALAMAALTFVGFRKAPEEIRERWSLGAAAIAATTTGLLWGFVASLFFGFGLLLREGLRAFGASRFELPGFLGAEIWALLGALALFWVSTRQFPGLVRLAIWVAGVWLLAWAAALAPAQDFGLSQAIDNALSTGFQDSALAHALSRNASTIAQFVPQLLDFFFVAATLMATLALLAFTRGEKLEQALRPAILTLLGFIAGSAATLAVVAIGLGGQVKPQTYFGVVAERTLDDEASVYDGDTFTLGEVSLRLWGVDAPELHQPCRRGDAEIVDCGEAARDRLNELIVGRLVQCDRRRSLDSGQTETFGRPLVQCWTIDGEARMEVGAAMISAGYAIPYRNDALYGFQDAADNGVGRALMVLCSLRPDVWRSRNGRVAREIFERDGAIIEGAPTMGDCAAAPRIQR